MRCVVTGAAGFIGSHLCEALLLRGHSVVGIDAFVPFYSPALKANNHSELLAHPQYHFHALDLRRDDLENAVAEADIVFHFASMPGITRSWCDFENYLSCNVLATQRLLEAVRTSLGNLKKFVMASSSSVYGDYALGNEFACTEPKSPYGVTKLMGEKLCRTYAEAFEIPLVILRLFSVYGKRQRPDMAIHRFIRGLIREQPIEVFGDGLQTRGYTHISDCVSAVIAAVEAPSGEIYNIGGNEFTTMLDIIHKLETLSGLDAKLVFKPSRLGDPRQSFADTTKMRNHLGWRPQTSLQEGLQQQWRWQTKCEEHTHENLFAEPAGTLS